MATIYKLTADGEPVTREEFEAYLASRRGDSAENDSPPVGGAKKTKAPAPVTENTDE